VVIDRPTGEAFVALEDGTSIRAAGNIWILGMLKGYDGAHHDLAPD